MIRYRGSALRTPTFCESRGISSVLRQALGFYVVRDVAQLVARCAGGAEVASSSLVIPTNRIER